MLIVICIALDVPPKPPSSELIRRWFSEPIRSLILADDIFGVDNSGQVYLDHALERLVIHFSSRKDPPWLMILPTDPTWNGCRLNASIPVRKDRPEPQDVEMDDTGDPPLQPIEPIEILSFQTPQVPPKVGYSHCNVRYLRQNIQDKLPIYTQSDRDLVRFQDCLQDPLQPLHDNLESQFYETFERDLVKYKKYEEAIFAALRDWRDSGRFRSGPRGKRLVLAVVGAGRGPLIDCALRAAENVGMNFSNLELWAVEKNPSACFHLRKRNFAEWSSQVKIAQADMRSWCGPTWFEGSDGGNSLNFRYQVDIVVSELLGSFGDNELSPECLDGVLPYLNFEGAVMIPYEYTSYLTPISAPKQHGDVTERKSWRNSATNAAGSVAETPYVSYLHCVDYMSRAKTTAKDVNEDHEGTETPDDRVINKVWTFHHPTSEDTMENSKQNYHNARAFHATFPIQHNGTIHGFAGYFEAVLYDSEKFKAIAKIPLDVWRNKRTFRPDNTSISDPLVPRVELSTHPLRKDSKSPDMHSWFPIYFPLKEPLYVIDNSEIDVCMFRKTDGRRVWYEWAVEAFSRFGRSTGARTRLGSSGPCSSEGNACLM